MDEASSMMASDCNSSTLKLTSLERILRWNCDAVEMRDWRNQYEKFLLIRFNTLFAQRDEDKCLLDAFNLMPESLAKDFLCAPGVASILCRRSEYAEWQGKALAQLLLKVFANDLWLSPRNSRLTFADTKIVLDIESDFAFPDDKFGIAETVHVEEPALAMVLNKIVQAFNLVRDVSPRATEAVKTFIDVLAIRNEPSKLTGAARHFYSSTFSGYAGLVRFTNVGAENTSEEILADAFVHESIHGLLYVYEAVASPLQSADANDIVMHSPWTGALISLPSYLQACVVWYGLFHFWELAIRNGVAVGRNVVELSTRARSGFLKRPFSSIPSSIHGHIAPEMSELLDGLEHHMLTQEF